MLTLLIVLVCAVIAAWVVSILPQPSSGFPIKTILYVIIGVLLIAYLLRFGRII